MYAPFRVYEYKQCSMYDAWKKFLISLKYLKYSLMVCTFLTSRVNSAESEGGGSLTRSILFVLQGRRVLPAALRNLFNRLTSLFKKNSRVNSHRHSRDGKIICRERDQNNEFTRAIWTAGFINLEKTFVNSFSFVNTCSWNLSQLKHVKTLRLSWLFSNPLQTILGAAEPFKFANYAMGLLVP